VLISLPFLASDHFPVVCSFNICANYEKSNPTMKSLGHINGIDSEKFSADIQNANLNSPTSEIMRK